MRSVASSRVWPSWAVTSWCTALLLLVLGCPELLAGLVLLVPYRAEVADRDGGS